MTRWLFAGIASLTLVACGLVHGYWTDRWHQSTVVTEAVEQMHQLPMEIGPWTATEIEMKPGEAGKDVAGCLQRRYRNRRTGNSVLLFVVCGRAGPVSIHTPEVCYGASGYQVDTPRRSRLAGIEGAEFWLSDAVRKRTAEETRLRIYWGWTAGEGWVASSNPRVYFARQPVLFKLYVQRELQGPKDRTQPEPCESFLRVVLPVFKKTITTLGS